MPQNGIMVIPTKISDGYINDCPKILAEYIAAMLTLRIVRFDDFQMDQVIDGDLVISMVIPSQSFDGNWKELPPRVKFVYWMDDGQWKNHNRYIQISDTLARADLIIYCNKSQFLSLWGEYESKAYWCPLFATPQFEIAYNHDPEMVCAMSGNSTACWYPLRHKVIAQGPAKLGTKLQILEHPGYGCQRKHGIIGEHYACWLNQYYCGVTDNSRNWETLKYNNDRTSRFADEYVDKFFTAETRNRGQVLKKYFEITMVGCLLIADDSTPEMNELGFTKDTFVTATENDVLDVIDECLKNPIKYESIRLAGFNMSQKRHTWKTRRKELDDILSLLAEI